MQDLSVICICQQKTFSPVLSINSSQKENFVTSSCISGTACLISCEISLFVTAANREGIVQLWRLSLGGTGGESVNSEGYSLIE